MADSMKRPPMQNQAARLAAQGRYGDSMLVHMNPAEVQGIASLAPGGQLPTNPQTGQPEAWGLEAVLAAVGALKGRRDAGLWDPNLRDGQGGIVLDNDFLQTLS